MRNLDTNFQLAQTNANRWNAAQREVEALDALYRGGRVSLDLALEAQRRRAVAQAEFWRAVCEYNKSIADLHNRKGSIMDYDGIAFEEGPWPQKAYWDALGRARERDAAWYIDYGWTRPSVISRGAISQGSLSGDQAMVVPEGATIEEVPSPEPTPAQPRAENTGTSTSPLPAPQPVPQDTRSTPRQRTERAAVMASEPETPAAVTRPVTASMNRSPARQGVAPAAYWAAGPSDDSNPLRGTSRPVGTGVRATEE
jgi:hypothetical protein